MTEVTILLYHHNESTLIKAAVNSVLNQTDERWRLLICDDHSSKNHLQELESIASGNRRITVIRNKEKLGYINTLKKMVDSSETTIVGIMSTCDSLAKEAVEQTLEAYNQDLELGFTYSDLLVCDKDLKPIRRQSSKNLNGEIVNLNTDQYNHFRTFKKEDYYKAGGYDSLYKYAEDYDLSYKLKEHSKGLHIKAPLYLYRIKPLDRQYSFEKQQRAKLSHILAILSAYRRCKERLNKDLINEDQLFNLIHKIRSSPKYYAVKYAKKKDFHNIFDYCSHILITRLFEPILHRIESLTTKHFHLKLKLLITLKKNFHQFKAGLNPNRVPQSLHRIVGIHCHEKQFAFVGIPKNGSSTLKRILLEQDFSFTSPEEIKGFVHEVIGHSTDGHYSIKMKNFNELSDKVIKFAVYRDPVDRLISFYNDKVLNMDIAKNFNFTVYNDLIGADTERFIQAIERISQDFDSSESDLHILPQSFFLKDAQIDYLVPIEFLDNFIINILGIQTNKKDNASLTNQDERTKQFNNEQILRIENIYKSDSDLLLRFEKQIYRS